MLVNAGKRVPIVGQSSQYTGCLKTGCSLQHLNHAKLGPYRASYISSFKQQIMNLSTLTTLVWYKNFTNTNLLLEQVLKKLEQGLIMSAEHEEALYNGPLQPQIFVNDKILYLLCSLGRPIFAMVTNFALISP